MIPREYWRQMYEELSRIDWGHFRTDADKVQERAHERLAAEYDAAIEWNRKQKKRAYAVKRHHESKRAENQRQWRKEHRSELTAYHREWRKRKKAEKAAQKNTQQTNQEDNQ